MTISLNMLANKITDEIINDIVNILSNNITNDLAKDHVNTSICCTRPQRYFLLVSHCKKGSPTIQHQEYTR